MTEIGYIYSEVNVLTKWHLSDEAHIESVLSIAGVNLTHITFN